jgi:carbonic anhydrase/acetyltransferase-like protein (isoleucine patch superfamily)
MTNDNIIKFNDILPTIDKSCFIAHTAVISGDTHIGEDSNIWYGCVLRGDVDKIRIGKRTNIQDLTMVHVSSFDNATIIGDDVTIGHSAVIHACEINDGAFVGMQACIMDGAVIEKGAMVAAGSLVTAGKRVPSGELWAGRPAKFMRKLTDEDYKHMKWSSSHYVKLSKKYM